MENHEWKFKKGDVLEHKASGKRAVVISLEEVLGQEGVFVIQTPGPIYRLEFDTGKTDWYYQERVELTYKKVS